MLLLVRVSITLSPAVKVVQSYCLKCPSSLLLTEEYSLLERTLLADQLLLSTVPDELDAISLD